MPALDSSGDRVVTNQPLEATLVATSAKEAAAMIATLSIGTGAKMFPVAPALNVASVTAATAPPRDHADY